MVTVHATTETETTSRHAESLIREPQSGRAEPVSALHRESLGEDRHSLDLLDLVFVIGAFSAPMDLTILKSFTADDLSVSVLAFLRKTD